MFSSFGEAEPIDPEAEERSQEPEGPGSERRTPGERSTGAGDVAGDEPRHGQSWTDEEWEAWRGRWRMPPPASERSSGETARPWSWYAGGTTDAWLDPWWQSRGDPWGANRNEDSAWTTTGGSGGGDKIPVPEFDGEEQAGHEGTRARGYLRRVNAWRRITRLKPCKQALALYNHLSGKAWRDAEELDLDLLDQDSGLDVFIGWISTKYLDREVVKVGRCMSEFFKVLKKTTGQDIRDFNQEFDRQASRLKEVGCQLPDLCLAWWYLDKLRLDNSSELNLLSSTGNTYSLQKLQEAAIIQDRMNRRMWESRRGSKEQRALVADYIDEEDDGDEGTDEDDGAEDIDDDETQEAFVAFQNAKSRYQSMVKARGTTTTSASSREDRLKLAKAKSYCSECKKKGYWHKDPICPLHPSNRKEGVKEAQTAHVVYFTDIVDDEKKLHAITDSACSRTLAGSGWLTRYCELARTCNVPYKVVRQDEVFKFGGQKLYPSARAVVAWFNVEGRWLLVKISEVNTQVPLLLSRPTLAAMGMNFNVGKNVADFVRLGIKGIQLGTTESGHPTIPVTCAGGPVPTWPDGVDWKVTETWIPTRPGVYMVREVRVASTHIFYPKKLLPGIHDLLTAVELSCEGFLHWWRDSPISRDFWIETHDYLDRIHVTPRRYLFNPEDWSTPLDEVRHKLLDNIGGVRCTTCIPCLGNGLPWRLEHGHADWDSLQDLGKLIWVGRSRFKRKVLSSSIANAEPMGHEEGGDRRRAADPQGYIPRDVDGPGAALLAHGVQAGGQQGAEGPAALAHEPPGPQGQVHRGRHPGAGEGLEGDAPTTTPGQRGGGAQDDGDLRPVRGVPARGGTRGLPGLGGAGGESQGGRGDVTVPRSGEDGNLVEVGPSEAHYGDQAAEELPQSGGERHGTVAGPQPGSDQATAGTDDLHERLNRLLQDEQPAGVSRDPRGGHGLLHGDTPRGRDHYREDHRAGGAARGAQGSPRGSEGEGEAGGPEGEEESVDSRESRGTTRLKKRLHWKKVQDAIRDKKNNRKHDTRSLDFVSSSPDVESESVTVDAHEEEFREYKEPRVTLIYGDDYDVVRNLPRRRVKRVARKRIGSWARKAFMALVTSMAALVHPVVEGCRDALEAFVGSAVEERADFLELFAGCARMTEEFARAGYSVLEPRDILMGHDLFTEDAQADVWHDLRNGRPHLIWIALPCTKWSSWQRLNYHGRKQHLRRERMKQRRLVRFSVEVAKEQMRQGGLVAFEHPRWSDMWTDQVMRELWEHPDMREADFDMCRYGLRSATTAGLHRKPTKVLCNSGVMANGLSRKCHGGHGHAPTAGADTRPAGNYSREFCRAVVKLYVEARERNIWDAFVSAGEEAAGEVEVLEPTESAMVAEGAEGITFPEHVPKNIARALRRVHQNLGHPSNADLARHLRLAGAQEQAVKGALQLRCQTCLRHARPQISRPGRLVRTLDFGQEVGLDIFNLYTVDKEKLVVMSILDLASGYHVVRKIYGKKSEHYAKLFLEAWASWAGRPNRLVVDQERGFMKTFTDEMERHGIHAHYIAGQAHWQNGMVERQNGWFRSIWEKVVDEKSIYATEAEWTLMEVCHAKNTLRRSHGYSPSQWVFGGEPRTGDPSLDGDEDDLQPLTTTPTTEWVRRQEIRVSARKAFVVTQAEDTMKRALQGRPRVQHGDFHTGDWVYVYRKTKVPGGAARQRQDAGEWIGPGVLVGQEGDNFWVSRGGRCMLCAREHLRQAESEEVGSLLQTRVMKEDMLRLIQNLDRDDGDEDIYLDAVPPAAGGHGRGTVRHRDQDDDAPHRRLRFKQAMQERKRKGLPMDEDAAEEHASDGAGGDRRDLSQAASSAMVAERGLTKAQQGKLDKEIKWEEIPEEERHLYIAAEKKQWDDHLRCEAVRVLTDQETLHVRETFPKERILRSRFAYRDKHCAKRREDPSVPPKAKARLCVGGHRDPDLKTGELRTEAPTPSKGALSALMVLSSIYHWDVAAGDIECAFLQGMENQRNLYMEQPVRGLPELRKGCWFRC